MTETTNDCCDSILDYLADHVEEIDPDIEGRLSSARRVLKDTHEILTLAARQIHGFPYSSKAQGDGSLLLGGLLTAKVMSDGRIGLFRTHGGEELPALDLVFDARQREWRGRWRHIPPVKAILEAALPVLKAARPHRGGSGTPDIDTINAMPANRESPARNVIPLHPRSPAGKAASSKKGSRRRR